MANDLYLKGHDCYQKKDYEKVYYYYLKSATDFQDYFLACLGLAKMYEKGEGVDEDIYQALQWYEKNNSRARFDPPYEYSSNYSIARLYNAGGPGLERDNEKAIGYYKKVKTKEGMSF